MGFKRKPSALHCRFDGQSIFSRFRMKRYDQAMASDDVDAAVRLLLRKIAHLHYSNENSSVKASIRSNFWDIDESRDGQISLKEFLQRAITQEEQGSYSQDRLIPKIFEFLDSDGSGFLEFDEYLTLHYLMHSGLQLCDSCHNPIMLLGYTCRTCWFQKSLHDGVDHNGNSPCDQNGDGDDNDNDTFDLCFSCYASKSYSHEHTDFADVNTMYNLLMKTSSNSKADDSGQVQCNICGDFHAKDMESVLVENQKHVMKNQDEFICEWCSCWMCDNCGRYFQGGASTSEPNKWLKTNICCSLCRSHGFRSDLTQVFTALDILGLNKKCKTCAIKVKKGILWSSYARRENTNTNTSYVDASSISLRLSKMLL